MSLPPLRVADRLEMLVTSRRFKFGRTEVSMAENQTESKQVLPKYITRASAARLLKVTPFTIDRLVRTQHLPTWQVPGHSRKWISNEAVQRLAQQAAGVGDMA